MTSPAELRRRVGGIDTDWMDAAACIGVDPDLFFPERGGDVAAAKEVCRACPVRMTCLEYAIATVEKFGVWGGMSERERRRIRRGRIPITSPVTIRYEDKEPSP